ncbi:MAG TPA: putative glycolipid-binding domain-containing protein [Myxococcaceae bacterium]|nr:putative glycolipid-binding domain-containing protein [Myxococcaceae bacterium]
MPQTRTWRRLDLPSLEEFEEEQRTFRGRVTVQETPPWTVEYRILFDEGWVTRSAEADVTRAGTTRRLVLRREPHGRWFVAEREIDSCRGALDVDLGVTPSTNTSAIRRLGLDVGASAELTAAWVRFPELSVEPLSQRYSRLDERTYLYESVRGGRVVFHARLEVDPGGLVERYERLFERVDGGAPG